MKKFLLFVAVLAMCAADVNAGCGCGRGRVRSVVGRARSVRPVARARGLAGRIIGRVQRIRCCASSGTAAQGSSPVQTTSPGVEAAPPAPR